MTEAIRRLDRIEKRVATLQASLIAPPDGDVSVFATIPKNEYIAILAGTTTYDTTTAINAVVASGRSVAFPPGDYHIKSTTGTGRETHSLLFEDLDGFELIGREGSRILAQAGSHVRTMLFRNCSNFTIDGLTLVNVAAAAGMGFCFENCTDFTIRNCKAIDFNSYGFVVSENTGRYLYQASTISFDAASQEIRDSANGLLGPVAGERLYIGNSVSNNGFVSVVSAAAGVIVVDQVEIGDVTLVDEAAGASGAELIDTTISFDGSTLSVGNGLLYFLDEGDAFTVAGSGSNDGTYTVVAVGPEGVSLTIDGTFVTEAAGASITLERVGKPLVQVWDVAPCDNPTFENNRAENCGIYGFELFPKALSKNLKIIGNTAEDCGFLNTAGCGIKAGTNYINALLKDNHILHCQMGMNLGNFRATVVEGNHIANCEKWGMAITMSSHAKAPLTTYGSLIIRNNWIGFTTDPATGVQFVPAVVNRPAININGLIADIGLLEITDNTLFNWGTGGILVNKSYVSYTNIKIHHNTVIDSGGVIVIPLSGFTASTTSGSPVLTDIVNEDTGTTPTAGWLVDAEIVHPYVPAGTTIIAIDQALNTMTMSANADTTAALVPIRAGLPAAMEVNFNHFESTAAFSTNIVRVWSDGGQIRGNTIIGFGEYPVQAMCTTGTEFWITNNDIRRPNQGNPTPVANRGPFLTGTITDAAGVYHVLDNAIDLSAAGQAAYLVNSQFAGTLYLGDGNTTGQYNLDTTISGGTVPTSQMRYSGKRRMLDSTNAPTSGAWLNGDEVINTTLTAARAIDRWRNITGGSPGTWIALGRGRGTLAQRPTLVVGDAEYVYWDSTIGREIIWSGTAWEWPALVRTMYRATAGKTVANTTSELTIVPTGSGSMALPVDYFRAGASLRIVAYGTFRTTGTPTLQIKLKHAATVLLDTGAVTFPTIGTAVTWRMEFLVTSRSAGATGVLVSGMLWTYSTTTTIGQMDVINVPQVLTSPFDTTAAGSLSVTAQWSAASASNTITTNMLIAEDMG